MLGWFLTLGTPYLLPNLWSMDEPSGAEGHRAGLALLSTPAPPSYSSCHSSALLVHPLGQPHGAAGAGVWPVMLWASPQATGELRAGSAAAPHLDKRCCETRGTGGCPGPALLPGAQRKNLSDRLSSECPCRVPQSGAATPSSAFWQGAAYKCPLTSAREARGPGQTCRTGTSRHLAQASGDTGTGPRAGLAARQHRGW